MMKRYLPLCAAALVACGPEVTAREVPSLDELANAGRAPAELVLRPEDPAPAPGSAALAAALSTAQTEISLPALLYSDLDADVAARADGTVLSISADLGDAVRAGQLLARLDDAREVARVEAAAAAFERARADHERMAGLHENGFVTSQELDHARYQLRTAEADLRVAQVDLEYRRVVAPFAGVVTRRHTGVGRSVEERDALFRITALQPLRATARLPEHDARGLRTGTAAILVDAAGNQVDARVIRVSPAVEPGSGTVEVLLGVPQPGPLLPGSSVTLRLPRPESRAP